MLQNERNMRHIRHKFEAGTYFDLLRKFPSVIKKFQSIKLENILYK